MYDDGRSIYLKDFPLYTFGSNLSYRQWCWNKSDQLLELSSCIRLWVAGGASSLPFLSILAQRNFDP